MKINKYIYVLATSLFVASCSSDDLAVNDSQKQVEQVSDTSMFSGTISDMLESEPTEGCDGEEVKQTRSTISGGVFSSWNENDVISVSDGTLYYQYKPSTINGSSCSFAVVDGKNQFDKTGNAGKTFYVFYPATAVTSWNGSTVNSMVYAQQLYTENVDNGEMGAYMATSAAVNDAGNVSFDFKHCCSVVEVNLSTLGVTPKTISLKSNSGVSLAGKIAYNISTGAITVSNNDATDYSYSTQSDVITLSDVASDATIARFYILPVLLDGGVTVTIEDTDGNFYTKSTSSSIGTATSDITMSNVTDGSGTAAVVCKPYYKKVDFGAASSATKKGDWMATLPGNVFMHQLSIPGAHDCATASLNDATWLKEIAQNASYTQSKHIWQQLDCGVRAFDLRPPYCGLDEEPTTATIEIFHGMMNTKMKFAALMDTLCTFVKNNPTETIFCFISKENGTCSNELLKTAIGANSTSTTDYSNSEGNYAWQTCIREYLDGTYTAGALAGKQTDYLYGALSDHMKLQDCRGKVVVVCRNAYGTGSNANYACTYGGYIRTWSDNITFDCSLYNNGYNWCTDASVQDNYNTGDEDTKLASVTSMLQKSSTDNSTKWYFNFVNMAKVVEYTDVLSTNLSPCYPKNHAVNMNSSVASAISNLAVNGKTGVMFFDFCGDENRNGQTLMKAILNQNYKYVFGGRTRKATTSSITTGAIVSGDEYADDTQVYSKKR